MQFLKQILSLVLVLAQARAIAGRAVVPEDGVAHAQPIGPATVDADTTVTATTTVRVTVTVSSAPAPAHSATESAAPAPASASSHAIAISESSLPSAHPTSAPHTTSEAVRTTAGHASTRTAPKVATGPNDDPSPPEEDPAPPRSDPALPPGATPPASNPPPAPVSGSGSLSGSGSGSGSARFSSGALPSGSGSGSVNASASATLSASNGTSASAVLFTPDPSRSEVTVPTFRDNGAAARVRGGSESALGIAMMAVAVVGGGMVALAL